MFDSTPTIEHPREPARPAAPDLELIDELVDAATQIAGLECAVRLEFVRLVARLDAAGAWQADGQTSLATWLGFRYGLRARTARETVLVAAVIDALPALADAFGQGRLSWDQLVPLCQLASPETDAAWAADGPGIAAEDLHRMVRSKRQRESAGTEAHERRGIAFRPHGVGGTSTHIVGETTDAERLRVLLDRIREEEAVVDPETGTRPSVAQQRYDALVSLTRRTLAGDVDVDRATVVVHADIDLLTDENPDGAATTPQGDPVAAETVRRHCCDGRIEWSIDGPDGTALGVGRATRVWPPWLSRLIRRRDERCRFPGCARPIHEIHHVRYWTPHRGRTDDDNGIGLCWTHHRHVHEGGWTLTGNPNAEVTFTGPHGSVVCSRPRRLSPEVKRRMRGVAPGLFETEP